MPDYLQIGGSSGLDTANMLVSDSVCGAARDPSINSKSNCIHFKYNNSFTFIFNRNGRRNDRMRHHDCAAGLERAPSQLGAGCHTPS